MKPVGPSHSRNRLLPRDRFLLGATCLLLSLSYISGGSSQETNAGVMFTQLLSVPLLLFALREARCRGILVAMRWHIAILALIMAIPLVQLLPLSESLWNLPDARGFLQRDLAEVGVSSIQYRWSLAPSATERDLLSLLPAVALFFCALTLGSDAQRRCYWAVIALSFSSLILGIAQVGAGKDSVFNLYPQWPPAMGGVFANPNHQAASIAVSLVLAIALLLDARNRVKRGEYPPFLPFLFGVLIAIFIAAIPMLGSRAGPIIAVVPAVIFLLASGIVPLDRLRQHRGAQIMLAIVALALLVGLYSALGWTSGDRVDTIRSALRSQTILIGDTHAPLGGGLGSFVTLFEQGADVALLNGEYINAAHNEYAQLWLEGGVSAMVGVVVLLTWFGYCFFCMLVSGGRSRTRIRGLAAATGLFVIVLHSWVDYPLRTPSLMAVFALLAGILAATVLQRNSTAG